MNRRRFVKALAGLPAAVGGLLVAPKILNPSDAAPSIAAGDALIDRVAKATDIPSHVLTEGMDPEVFDAFLRQSTHLRVLEENRADLFDQWLDFVGQPQYKCEKIPGGFQHTLHVGQPIEVNVGCEIDGQKIIGQVESLEIDYRRDFVVAEIGEPVAVPYSRGPEISIEIKVDDRMSARLQEIADEMNERAQALQEELLKDSVFADVTVAPASPGGMNDTEPVMTVIDESDPDAARREGLARWLR